LQHFYSLKCYSAVKKNFMWFQGKWMQSEDIMLNGVRQDEKHKICTFSLTWGK
jgi:hypothetical protein